MPESQPRKLCERPGCTNYLTGKQKKFCSNSCRAIASHMEKTATQRAIAESMMLQEIRERIEPVTRELLTDEVLQELAVLTDLLPMALSELRYELSVTEDGTPVVEDPDLRHKAAMQVLKWTIGNQSIAPASADQNPAPMQVFIGTGMQTPSPTALSDAEGTVEDEPEEERECLECHLQKPGNEFVGESNRCLSCHQKLMDSVREKWGGDLVRSPDASSE